MTHQRHRITHHRQPAQHGNLGLAIAQLAIGIVGGMARNKIAAQAHKRQAQSQESSKRR